MPVQITERGGARVSLPKGKGLEGEIRVMGWEPGATEVEGSSATYPVKTIKRDFAEAFPVGTRMRANHDGICEGGGDIRRIVAKTTGVPVHKENHEMGPGMYAPVIFSEQWSPFVTEFADVVGVSISAGAEVEPQEFPDDQARDDWGRPVDEDGNAILPIVSRFLTASESPYNSIDVVEAPGADGRIVAVALESAKHQVEGFVIREAAQFALGTRKTPRESVEQKDSSAPPPQKEGKASMDEKEIQALAEALTPRVTAGVVEALKPAQLKEDEPSLSATVEAVVQAGLTEKGRKAVLKRIENGDDADTAIAEQKALEDDIRAEFGGDGAPASTSTENFGVTFAPGEAKSATVDQAKVDEDFEALMSAGSKVV